MGKFSQGADSAGKLQKLSTNTLNTGKMGRGGSSKKGYGVLKWA